MTSKELLALHDSTYIECKQIMQTKNSDYTGGKNATDPFANFKSSTVLGVHPVLGLLMRVLDKIQRIRSFVNDSELQVPNESVEDAFNDIINYMILGKGLLMEERANVADEQGVQFLEPIPRYDD